MYSGRQKTLSLLPTQQIALAFGIALFVLILFLAGRAAFQRAQESAPGFTHGLTHGADQEMNDGISGGANRGLAARTGNASPLPTSGGNYRTPSFGALASVGASGEPVLFIGDGEKEAAKASLVPLHELMENVRRFDGTIWNGTVSAADDAPKQNPSLVLEALESDAALVSHPLRFPEPLQNDAMETARELQTYLETVRQTGIGLHGTPKSDDLPDVQAAAHRHLENGARLLARLDAAAGGTVGGGDTTASAPGAYSGLP